MQIILHDYIPPPCQRPRLGNGHVYSPSSKPEQSMAWHILASISHQCPQFQYPILSPCRVGMDFYLKLNQTIITVEPLPELSFRGKIDLDNRIKFVNDALEKANVFRNDSQVCSLYSNYYL